MTEIKTEIPPSILISISMMSLLSEVSRCMTAWLSSELKA